MYSRSGKAFAAIHTGTVGRRVYLFQTALDSFDQFDVARALNIQVESATGSLEIVGVDLLNIPELTHADDLLDGLARELDAEHVAR